MPDTDPSDGIENKTLFFPRYSPFIIKTYLIRDGIKGKDILFEGNSFNSLS